MAVAGATIAASCFSTAATSNGSTPPKQSDFVLRMACMRTPPSISHSHSLPITPICRKWGKTAKMEFKVFAAVEQDEVLSSVVESESTVETVVEQEIEKEEEEVISSSELGEEATEEKEEEAPVPAVNTKLYFGNLPYNCDSAQLAGIIQEYGSPELVEVLYDRITGRSRGFAFVTMSSIEDANSVINNLDGSEYAGRRLKVNFSDKPKPKQPIYPETEYKLFVGNLSWSVTSEMLLQAFQQYGNVVGARVLFDGDTGRSRGYGFVSYSSKEEMEAALGSLNGMELDGREMRVSLAQGKKY